MAFVKANWISLTCGVVALAAIALALLGMSSDSVQRAMQSRAELAGQISSLRSSAQNERTIEAEKRLAQRFEQEYEAVLKTAETINQRKPLLDDVFPRPASMESQYRFKEQYHKGLYELPREIKAGDLPSPDEIYDEAEIMAELERRRRQEAGEDLAEAAQAGPSEPVAGVGRGVPPPTGGGRGVPPPTGGGRGEPAPVGRGAPVAPAGRGAPQPAPAGRGAAQAPSGRGVAAPAQPGLERQFPPEVSQEDARHRASVRKARNVRMYVSPLTSLHFSPIVESVEAPTPRDMWYAQVGFWIQEDLLRALGNLNEEVAKTLPEKEANVTSLPVKRVERILLHGYITKEGVIVPFPAVSTSPADAGLRPTFTGRRSDDQFDVVRLQLVVIVEKRRLLDLIDHVTRSNFYRLVNASFTQVESADPQGFFYGAQPVVRAELDFEGFFARRLYIDLMPEDVKRDLGLAAGGQQPR